METPEIGTLRVGSEFAERWEMIRRLVLSMGTLISYINFSTNVLHGTSPPGELKRLRLQCTEYTLYHV